MKINQQYIYYYRIKCCVHVSYAGGCAPARYPARGQPAGSMIGEKWRISPLKKIYVTGCFTNMKSGTLKSTIKYNFDIL